VIPLQEATPSVPAPQQQIPLSKDNHLTQKRQDGTIWGAFHPNDLLAL